MFTGIIETIGSIKEIRSENSNIIFTIKSPLSKELKIDQSVAHNGVCLTVTSCTDSEFQVTLVEETLKKSSLGTLKAGDSVNLERSMLMNGRIDGHIVQGHVDQIATCKNISDQNGSWVCTFSYDPSSGNVTVEKGSICVNGVSLTVVNSKVGEFSVAIIPYTFENTNFKDLKAGDIVNLEFDIIGKYVKRLMEVPGFIANKI